MALRAPSTSRCDFCQVSFCGVGIPERCCASSLRSQNLNGFSDLGDLIQAADIYECFEGNTVEVDILFDYLTEHRMTPKQIYQEVRVPRVLRPETPNHWPRSSNRFRTPPNNSRRYLTRSSSQRSTELPEVSIPTQPHPVRESVGGVLPRFSCGEFATGGSGSGGRAAFLLLFSTNQTARAGRRAGIRKIQVRIPLLLWLRQRSSRRDIDHARECTFPPFVPAWCHAEQVVPVLVNHMIDTPTEKTAEPMAGSSQVLASASGTMMSHHEPHGIAAT